MRYIAKQWAVRMSIALSIGLGAVNSLNAQRLTWLGTLAEGYSSSAFGVSADGEVVVGWATNASGWSRAFRWTERDGMQDLGTLGGDSSEAYGVSANGEVVVGRALNASGEFRAFRWTPATGMVDLGTLPWGYWSYAFGVSADGSVVVGTARNAIYQDCAFRWTEQDGMQDLGTLGGISSYAYGVSANGEVVVGRSGNRAFRWTASNNQMQDLGTLPGGIESSAFGVSANGSVVVGWATDNRGRWFAFRWTASNNQMQYLGTLGGISSYAYGVSADGSVVVGRSNVEGQIRAFRWTEQGGMQDLNDTYAALLTNGSVLEAAFAISPDGRYIVGRGYNAATRREEAFLLDTRRTGDTNGDGCIDDADLLAVLFAFGTPGTGYTRHEDINKDGIVDDADLLTVLFNFGGGC